MARDRQQSILLSGFLLGVLARVLMLYYKGTDDMDQYFDWGNKTYINGLASAFHGIYFPIQYQFFSIGSWIVEITRIDFFVVFKAMNLSFDIGNFVLLAATLNKMKCDPLFSHLYWLHPWFLVVFSLGYIDFQFVFFILLAVYLLINGQTFKHYLWAGLPLGIALLMKPQAQILLFTAGIYALAGYLRHRKMYRLALLIFPLLLFVSYDLYFFWKLYPTQGWKAAVILPYHFLTVSKIMPIMTGNMLNVWYPVAYVLKAPNAAIWTVDSLVHVLPHVQARFFATFITVGLISWYTVKTSMRDQGTAENGNYYLVIFTFAATVVPFIMTSAHENHFFLPSVLFVLLLAKSGDRQLSFAFQVTLIIQFMNIFLLYSLSSYQTLITKYYTYLVRTALSIVSVVLFLIIVNSFKKIAYCDLSYNS